MHKRFNLNVSLNLDQRTRAPQRQPAKALDTRHLDMLSRSAQVQTFELNVLMFTNQLISLRRLMLAAQGFRGLGRHQPD